MISRFLMDQPFCLFFNFKQFLLNENVDFSATRSQIIGIEGEHADHLTPPAGHECSLYYNENA